MACILHPKCNFLYGYPKCLIPVETVDVELKVKMVQASSCLGETGHPRLSNATPGAASSVCTLPS